jgi:NTP pyrophosphatase (non-canonical NTP hydrolase)
MTPQEYVKLATTTEAPVEGAISRLGDKQVVRVLHASIGLCTETGELQDALKKHIFYGKPLDEAMLVNLKEELGDIMWYVAIACDALGADLGEVMEKNIAKLKARYPDKFTTKDALNRNLDKEYKILSHGESKHSENDE